LPLIISSLANILYMFLTKDIYSIIGFSISLYFDLVGLAIAYAYEQDNRTIKNIYVQSCYIMSIFSFIITIVINNIHWPYTLYLNGNGLY
jgi:hypothetical protein